MSKFERDVVARDLFVEASKFEALQFADAAGWMGWKHRVDRWLADFILIETATEKLDMAGAETERIACGGCRYFDRYPKPNTQGMCYRYPPPGDDGFSVVNEGNWCGEFQKKEATT